MPLLGCLWMLASAVVQLVVAAKLWNALGWPWWIFGLLFTLIPVGLDLFFAIGMLVAVIAGFFGDAWPWSLATLAATIGGLIGNALLGAGRIRKSGDMT